MIESIHLQMILFGYSNENCFPQNDLQSHHIVIVFDICKQKTKK